VVARTDELYQLAEQLLDSYKLAIHELLNRVGLREDSLIMGPLKDPVRIYEKAMDDYSSGRFDLDDGVLPEAWVTDILRCQIVVRYGQSRKLFELQELLSQEGGVRVRRREADTSLFWQGDATQGGTDDVKLNLVRVKNRFSTLITTHFRYVLNNIQLSKGPLSMICEIQVTHDLILAWDQKQNGRRKYNFFRAALQKQGDYVTQVSHKEVGIRVQAYEQSVKRLSWFGLDFDVQQPEGFLADVLPT